MQHALPFTMSTMFPRGSGRRTRWPACTLVAVLCLACGARPGSPAEGPTAPKGEQRDSSEIEVGRTIITPDGTTSITDLFENANERFLAGDYDEAAKAFDRVHELDPDGRHAAEALFRAGIAHDESGRYEEANARFEQVARRFPNHSLARESLIRSIRVLLHLEQWKRAGQVAQAFSQKYPTPTPVEQVLVFGARGHAALATGDVETAHHQVERGRSVIERNRLDAAGKIPRDLAQLYYALGEIRRIRGEAITFEPLPPDFPIKLEQRAQYLLDAQSAYSDTMRAYDPHWSAMAGFRVGELYEKLHVDLMAIPAPDTADTRGRKDLFEGAMRLRYSVLLRKGMAMMEHTISMAKRTGERSAWVLRAEDAKRRLEEATRREDAAIDRLPYTREQLKEALDDLREKYRKKAASTS